MNKAAEIISLIGGIIYIVFIFISFFISFQLETIYQSVNFQRNPLLIYYPTIIVAFLAVSCFSFWIYLHHQSRRKHRVELGIPISVVLLCLIFVIASILTYSFVTPMYSLMSNFQ